MISVSEVLASCTGEFYSDNGLPHVFVVGVGSTVLRCVLYVLSWMVGQRAVLGTVRVVFLWALKGWENG